MSTRTSRYSIFLFAVVLAIHFRSDVETPFDSGWSVQVASSLARSGDVDLNEFAPHASADDYRIVELDGRLLPLYPTAPSVAVLPAYAVTKSVVKACVGFSLDKYYRDGGPTGGMERWLSSLLVAWCSVLVFWLARRELTVPRALLVAGTFAFATSSWSVVSRALWQHAPSMVCVALMLLALGPGDGRRRYGLAGVAVAAAYTMRPTNFLLVVAVTAYLIFRDRRGLPRYLAGAACVAIPFIVSNVLTWHQLLPPYFLMGGARVGLENWRQGLAGTLLSPGRGLFVYSPVLLFCLAGARMRLRRPAERDLAAMLVAVVAAHWLLISAWFSWWGGEVYGPRLFADLLPIAMYFLIPIVARLGLPAPTHSSIGWHAAWGVVFVLTLGWSVWIHSRGANHWEVWDWNRIPVGVEGHPERLWHWHDPPFLHDETLPDHRRPQVVADDLQAEPSA